MPESIHVGSDAAHTAGVSGNPEVVKQMLDMQAEGKKKAKEAEAQRKAKAAEKKAETPEMAALREEMADLKKSLEGLKGEYRKSEDVIDQLLKENKRLRDEAAGKTTPEAGGDDKGPGDKEPDGTHADAWKDWQDVIAEDDGKPPKGPDDTGDEDKGPSPEDERRAKVYEDFEQLRGSLDGAIDKYAVARVSREKMLGGKGAQAEMEMMGTNLQEAFENWSQGMSAVLLEQNKELVSYSTEANVNLDGWKGELNKLEGLRALPPHDRPKDLEAQITNAQGKITELNDYIADLNVRLTEMLSERERIVAQKLIEVRTKVDAAMLAEQERKHPRLSKITQWLQKHPKTRIAAGVALTGIGLFGAATGNLPLAGLAMAGKAGLRGFGTYNAVRGGGEWLANRKQGDINSAEDLVAAGNERSGKRSRNKKIAGVAAAAMAAAPIVGNLLHGQEAAPGGGGKTPENPGPGSEPNLPGGPEVPAPGNPDLSWLNSPEAQRMFGDPETFKKFYAWSEYQQKVMGYSPDQVAEMLARAAGNGPAQAVIANPGVTG